MDQFNFSNYKKELSVRKSQKGIHSPAHFLAKEICDWFGDYKEFGLWLGTISRMGFAEMKTKLDYIKEKKITNPKYLLAACRVKK